MSGGKSLLAVKVFGFIIFTLVISQLGVRAAFVSRRNVKHILPNSVHVAQLKAPTAIASDPSIVAARTKTSMSSSSTISNGAITHIPESDLPEWMLPQRTRVLTGLVSTLLEEGSGKAGSIVYWMQRDVRTVDNWALLLANHYAQESKLPLQVVYVLPPPPASESDDDLPPALADMPLSSRHGMFLLGGLEEVHKELKALQVPFHVLSPPCHDDVGATVDKFVVKAKAKAVITDFSPLRHFRQWNELQALPLLKKREIPLFQVDAHNVVPVWFASPKREVGARTLRPKIHKLVSDFTLEYPKLEGNEHLAKDAKKKLEMTEFPRKDYESFLQLDESVPPVDWAKPGTAAAMKQFQFFAEKGGLKIYDTQRNDPNEPNACSNMSAWLNHGQVSFQTLLMKVKKLNKYASGSASFVEEGLIRRELSDNYCYYTPNDYDSLNAAADWAKETLQVHTQDKREYLYTLEELEQGKTHDDLWNAAQLQAVREGGMHGFMRMYWAKKILEWTETPEIALRTAQYFNDKYCLDGRDPNGFVGVGWSIMGIHDQGWKEREVFGKIRFMNYNGCKRKFKIPNFVARYEGAAKNAEKAHMKHHGKDSEPPAKKQKTSKTSAKGKAKK